MPAINVDKFRTEVASVNKHLGRFTKSSLEPLLTELGPAATLLPGPQKLSRIQELVFHIPADKQLKYQAALNVLKLAGVAVCGRPCQPKMEFVRFESGPFPYVGVNESGKDFMVMLDPGDMHHIFDFKYKSTTGDLNSLRTVGTREHVKFRTSQRSAPFNDFMPTDMEFHWGESASGNSGYGRDDHSIKPPALVCRFPWVAGEVVAEQWYQYSVDNRATWHNIPGAAYLITKGVRQSGGNWVFYFRKSNWDPHNTVRSCFEAEYPMRPLAVRAKLGQRLGITNGRPTDISLMGRLISNV
jgi:hypothetical protein